MSQQVSYSGKPPVAAHALRGTTLTLSYTCPAEPLCGVSYAVQVPASVAVTVATGTGQVTLTSLAGTVTARADAGLITADDMRSAVASFKSNAGGVEATFSVAPRTLTATTDVGPITLTVPGSVGYRLEHAHDRRDLNVTVRRSDDAAHSISASSDLGSISVSPLVSRAVLLVLEHGEVAV